MSFTSYGIKLILLSWPENCIADAWSKSISKWCFPKNKSPGLYYISIVCSEIALYCYLYELANYLLVEIEEWLSWLGTLPLIWRCVVRFPQFFEKQLLGSTPTLLTVPRSVAWWCARRSRFPHVQAVCRLPRWSEFSLTLRLRQSSFAKEDDWWLTYTNKAREAHGLLSRSMKFHVYLRGLR